MGKLLVLLAAALALILYRNRAGAQPGVMSGAPDDDGTDTGADDPPPFPVPDGEDMSQSDALDNILQAMFQMEGGKPGDLNVRNENPGNLRAGPGMTGTSGGIATFGDIGDGWGDLSDYVTGHVKANPGWSFYDFFSYYLGGKTGGLVNNSQGSSKSYADYVANYSGFDPSQTMYGAIYGNGA